MRHGTEQTTHAEAIAVPPGRARPRWPVRRRGLAAGALLFALGAATGPPPAARAQAQAQAQAEAAAEDGAALVERLQRIADAYVAERSGPEGFTGVALQVSLGERAPTVAVASGTDGRTDRRGSGPRPMDEGTLFQIGSNTKSFTAALVLLLEAQGRLGLDQTLGEWLPQYRDPAWQKVTIRELLNMTSRIPDYNETEAIAREQAADIHRQFTPEELVAAVDPYEGSAVPPAPTLYSYSNTNYILAGLIIEEASGLDYATALRRWLLRPLGLRDTYYSDGPYPRRVLEREPATFDWDPSCPRYQTSPCPPSVRAPLLGRDLRTQNLSLAGPAGAVVASLGDLARWYRALFGGRVLPAQQLAEMKSLVSWKTGRPIADVGADDTFGFGLGLIRAYAPVVDGAVWLYEGETLGASTLIVYWPQHDLIVTASANSASAEGLLLNSLVVPVYAALKEAGVIPGAGTAAAVSVETSPGTTR